MNVQRHLTPFYVRAWRREWVQCIAGFLCLCVPALCDWLNRG